ncbi:SDR family oxidoreductase [Mariniphaga sediminis]|uniref:SDR family oxidoreductase n=1 Tax=Mariniphaga sediminis TaxID=1628158 RepID=A0A399D4H0_9BACT|nr:SDR family oxidoreductase [Mariniphaga sediminis]RIH65572.1 SDR family oxidoreductase [Mariniphaga sediminis]
METQNKVALITGASKGIGKAISIGLAKLGYQTILTGRNAKGLDETSAEIIREGCPAPKVFPMDITHSEKVKETVAQIVKDVGRIDVLVNNAGIYFGGSLELPEQDFKTMLDTNLSAQFVLLQEVVPVMKQQQSGYIFNIASRSGKVGFAGSGGYCASKFGLIGLSESLYNELTPQGIKVTALCPAWVNTTMAQQAGSPLPPETMIQPDDLFETIRWLLNLSSGSCVKEVVITNPASL